MISASVIIIQESNMFFKKRAETKTYDPSAQKPMLHKSICTGETTAGFKDLATGKYMDVMLVRNEKDLKKFMSTYAINTKPETEY